MIQKLKQSEGIEDDGLCRSVRSRNVIRLLKSRGIIRNPNPVRGGWHILSNFPTRFLPNIQSENFIKTESTLKIGSFRRIFFSIFVTSRQSRTKTRDGLLFCYIYQDRDLIFGKSFRRYFHTSKATNYFKFSLWKCRWHKTWFRISQRKNFCIIYIDILLYIYLYVICIDLWASNSSWFLLGWNEVPQNAKLLKWGRSCVYTAYIYIYTSINTYTQMTCLRGAFFE